MSIHINSASLRTDAAACSAIGRSRQQNQDHYFIDPDGHIFLVADGMGGLKAGRKASEIAINVLSASNNYDTSTSLDDATLIDLIRNAFSVANAEITKAGQLEDDPRGMGTTALLALEVGQRVFIGNVGDSRAYLLRDGQLRQLTVDHTAAQLLVESGIIPATQVRFHRWRHMLWKFLGNNSLSDGPDIQFMQVQPDDQLLLTTDGLTEVLEDDEVCKLLSQSIGAREAVEKLVQAAFAKQASDDVTCLVLHFRSDNNGI